MDGGDSEGDPRVKSEPRADGADLYRGSHYLAAVAPYLKDR